MNTPCLRFLPSVRTFSIASFAALCCSAALAQQPVELASANVPTLAVSSSLPDAPEAAAPEAMPEAAGFAGQQGALSNSPTAGKYAMVIQPGQSAPRLSIRTQAIAGLKDSFSATALVGWVASAGYEQIFDNSPNYGQTGKGFAQRLGAASARASSENIFTESILAPILHEDARYYRMGKGHNVIKRLVYAGTRELMTRTDGGHQTLNIANIGGNLAGSALTQAYYPPINRGFNQVMQTFGGSVGGSALGFVVEEFVPDLFHHGR